MPAHQIHEEDWWYSGKQDYICVPFNWHFSWFCGFVLELHLGVSLKWHCFYWQTRFCLITLLLRSIRIPINSIQNPMVFSFKIPCWMVVIPFWNGSHIYSARIGPNMDSYYKGQILWVQWYPFLIHLFPKKQRMLSESHLLSNFIHAL